MPRATRSRPLIVGLLLLGANAGAAAAPAQTLAASASAPATTLRVGRLTLHRCAEAPAWCGTLARALDPTGAVSGTIPLYFEYYPHSAPGAAAGTLVPLEGGPGFSNSGARDEHLVLFAPLRAHHDVLIMDYRGSGYSAALECRALQYGDLNRVNIGACGRWLGRRAPWYTTAPASDDLDALLDALGIGQVDLYSHSYGSYFAQVFAQRHPQKVHSLVLDGADLLEGPDFPWYPHYAVAMRDKFNLACERAPQCKAIPGSSIEHIAPALALLRARPLTASVRYGDGRRMHFTAGAAELAIVMFGGSPDYATVRETDAAARAFATGDRLPLLRLMAETLGSVDSRDARRSPVYFSATYAAAVSCQDPPQIFDMALPPPARRAARDAAIARRQAEAPDTYAPFTIDEFRAMPLDYEFIDQCVEWPAPAAGQPTPPLIAAGGPYPDVPVLVVSGEFDNQTSAAEGELAAAHFRRSHHVVIANSFHVNGLPSARSECGAILVRRFLESLTTGDERCAAAVPPVRLVPRFALRVSELAPAEGLTGNEAREAELQAVTGALLTCADAITRADEFGPGREVGLRGGTFTVANASAGYRLTLRAVRWTEDLEISGRIDSPGAIGTVRAELSLAGRAGISGTLAAQWPQGVAAARATVRGRLDGATLIADAPAP